MPLEFGPTGLGSGIDKDRPDYIVVTGEWEVGRIGETRGGPDNLRWFLVDDRQRSDDALRSRGDVGGSQGAISKDMLRKCVWNRTRARGASDDRAVPTHARSPTRTHLLFVRLDR